MHQHLIQCPLQELEEQSNPAGTLTPVAALLQAIYNSVILGDVRFPLLIYKQLLNRPFTFEVTAA